MSEKKDKLREKIFSSKKLKSKTIDLFGEAVEIRQPTVGQILTQAADEDPKKALVRLLVSYSYVPGSSEKVFTVEDGEQILGWPASGWLDQINTAISELTNIDIAGAEKNSEATTGG